MAQRYTQMKVEKANVLHMRKQLQSLTNLSRLNEDIVRYIVEFEQYSKCPTTPEFGSLMASQIIALLKLLGIG